MFTITHWHCQRFLPIAAGPSTSVAVAARSARKLAPFCGEVIGIDTDSACLEHARADHSLTNVTFLHGDVLTEHLPVAHFDFIVAVATLHHLPLQLVLHRFRSLLQPGGVLVIIGLYEMATPLDYAYAAAAIPVSKIIRFLRSEEQVGAPLADTHETLKEIRQESAAILSGSVLRRRLFFRYSLTWQRQVGS